ncbi:MAG: hypothetical protein IPH04_14915 [Saprospirales bacterium]|nr:hypothetical protein [Saprospirales bacterium]
MTTQTAVPDKRKAAIADMAKYCRMVEDLLHNSPTTSDPGKCDEYFQDLRAMYAFLAHQRGVVEIFFAKDFAAMIDKMDEERWKRIKGSSTMSELYAVAVSGEVAFYRIKIKELLNGIEQATTQLTTMISYRKMEMQKSI